MLQKKQEVSLPKLLPPISDFSVLIPSMKNMYHKIVKCCSVDSKCHCIILSFCIRQVK